MMAQISIPAVHKTKNVRLPHMDAHRRAKADDEFIILKEKIPRRFSFASFNTSATHYPFTIKKGIWPLRAGLWLKTDLASVRGYEEDWINADIALFHEKRSPFRGMHVEKSFYTLVRFKNKNIDVAIETTPIVSTLKFNGVVCNICFRSNTIFMLVGVNRICKGCATAEMFSNAGMIDAVKDWHSASMVHTLEFNESHKRHTIVDDNDTNNYMITDKNECLVKSYISNRHLYDFNYEKVVICKDII